MLLLLLPSAAHAHTGAVLIRGQYDWSNLPNAAPGAWIVWSVFPSIVIGCAGFIALYAALAGPLRRRWNLSPTPPTRGDWAKFVAAIAVVFCSLQGPLHELSDVYLFSAHMLQHLLITLIFPPLAISGIPPWMWRPLVRRPWALAIGRFITRPFIAGAIAVVTLYFWHVPAMYNAAMNNHNLHIFEHITFMTGAVIMWWPAYSRLPELPALPPLWRMLYLFCLTIPMKALGAVITISDYVLYQYYATQPRVGTFLDPLEDQKFGGLLMWLPGGLVFWFTIGFTFFRHFYASARREREGEALPVAAK